MDDLPFARRSDRGMQAIEMVNLIFLTQSKTKKKEKCSNLKSSSSKRSAYWEANVKQLSAPKYLKISNFESYDLIVFAYKKVQ